MYDVVRGALVYDTMSEVLVGLQEVCNNFVILRIKNRFAPVGEAGLSGGWRDVVVNMRIKVPRTITHSLTHSLTRYSLTHPPTHPAVVAGGVR